MCKNSLTMIKHFIHMWHSLKDQIIGTDILESKVFFCRKLVNETLRRRYIKLICKKNSNSNLPKEKKRVLFG